MAPRWQDGKWIDRHDGTSVESAAQAEGSRRAVASVELFFFYDVALDLLPGSEFAVWRFNLADQL